MMHEFEAVLAGRNGANKVIMTERRKKGEENGHMEKVSGKYGLRIKNSNGDMVCAFCETNGYVIAGTLFSHKGIDRATWLSRDWQTRYQIDYVLIKREWPR